MLWYNGGKNEEHLMSSNSLADRPQARPAPEQTSLQAAPSPVAAPPADSLAAWERLLLAEDDLADAPPIPLDMMRREALYGE